MTLTAPDLRQRTEPECTEPRCILYLRLSDARAESDSFPEREAALRKRAAVLGWRVVRVVIENDVIGGGGGRAGASAFKRRRVMLPDGRVKMRVYRPGFRSILDDMTYGRADALLAEDLDRAMRDPRDLEDLIDVAQAAGVHADSLSGSLRFTAGGTDAEITMARIMVTVANKSSRDTARRVSDGRRRSAHAGKFGGGRRPYGFAADGETRIPAECAEIAAWADAVLSGVPVRSIARDLIGREVPSAGGNPWTATSVRDILLRPRNAGISVHRNQAVGRLPGEPILADDVWRAVVATLTDPNGVVTWAAPGGGTRTQVRGTKGGRAPMYLGTGLFRCVCGQAVGVRCSKNKPRAYRCEAKGPGHIVRDLAAVDAMVKRWVVERLSRGDAKTLLSAPAEPGVDAGELRRQVATWRRKLLEYADDEREGHITRAQLHHNTKVLNAKIADAEQALAAQTGRSPLAPLIGATDVAEAWDALSLGARRAIVANLLTVTILPTPHGRWFVPATVRITVASQ